MSLLQLGLRTVAIGIAIAGVIDPAWSVSRPAVKQLTVVRALSMPGAEVEQSLRAALPGWQIESRDSELRVPCSPGARCVVLADGSKDVSLPDDLANAPSLVAIRPDDGANVSVRSVSVSRGHVSAAGVARVELSATSAPAQSEIRVLDGTAVVGSVMHEWNGASSARIDVPWWPIAAGARLLRVEVAPLQGERVTIDNQIDVGVDAATTRASVLEFDARPSWSSTFVRRALEDTTRFTVGHRARLAPALSAGTANGRLDIAALDLASVVVVGAPDALTPDDVALLDRFVNVRGGTLILLPERSPSGAWSRLLTGKWTEHLTAMPEAVGPLRASEVLRADSLPVTASVLARSGAAAAIAVTPSGDGRIVVSGAMDAWRYRDLAGGAFDSFWRSLIAEGAALGEGLQLTFAQPLAARGSRMRFTIQDRRMTPAASSDASAVARCGSEPAISIRLWPAGQPGEFTGELPLASGVCSIEATINDRHAVGSIAVADRPMFGVEQTLTKLERRVTESGGVVARAGNEAAIARALSAATLSPDVATVIHPMRAGWWIVPFAACLSLEWWLRRRNGLR